MRISRLAIDSLPIHPTFGILHKYIGKPLYPPVLGLYTINIMGDHSKQDQMLLVKQGKHIALCVPRRSYLIWPPVIESTVNSRSSPAAAGEGLRKSRGLDPYNTDRSCTANQIYAGSSGTAWYTVDGPQCHDPSHL